MGKIKHYHRGLILAKTDLKLAVLLLDRCRSETVIDRRDTLRTVVSDISNALTRIKKYTDEIDSGKTGVEKND